MLANQSIGSDESLVESIVRTVGAMEGKDPVEIPPLAETVDPDALARVWQSVSGSAARIAFEYADYTIVVNGDETIEVSVLDD